MNRQYLALDLGAESGRAILGQLSRHKIELAEIHRFSNTPVRLATGLYWDSLRLFYEMSEGIRAAAMQAGELDGIGVDTWGVDFGLVGGNGCLLDNPRHYRDARNCGMPEQLFRIVARAEVFRQTGIQFMEINSLYQLYATHRESPELLQLAQSLLFMPDLFNFFLTGTALSERTIASTSQFYDPVRRAFATDMLRQLGIHAGFLCELVDPGTELGPVLPYLSEHCGLKSETPVFTVGSHDTASAVAAVPSIRDDNWCFISSGTWSLMGVELEAPLINDASLEANYTNEVGVENRIRFLKNIPGLWVLQECRRHWSRQGQELSYAELMEQASVAKACETLLDLDLFVAPGDYPQRIQDYARHTGQQAPNEPGEFVRVILCSLAARYKQVLESLEKLTGKSMEVIHIVGGGSRNRLLNQLTADVTGRRVIAGPAEATAAGNALTQAMGTGEVKSLEELRAIVRNSFEVEEFRPGRLK
ncbi:MAG TPA: rhamnulokinase family protein [Bryobacteraceae bacterium]|jgi:rhamnulokinase|nr:rhamnulokinase family protein [Bryobacteraceae bacterium]